MLRLILWLLIGGSLAFGQSPVPEGVGSGMNPAKLSLAQAVEMSLQNNLDIEMDKSNVDTAVQSLQGSRGLYDYRVRSLTNFESRGTPTVSVFSSSMGTIGARALGGNVTLEKRLPFAGTSFEIGFETGRESSTDPLLALNPFTTARLDVTFTQPLARGWRIDAGRAQIRIRQKQVDFAKAEFELKIIETITQVETAYWDLVAARQDVTLKGDSVELARAQLNRTKRMVEEGSLPSVEIAAAEAEFERRRDNYYQIIGTVTNFENRLKRLLANGRTAAIWNEEIIPSEENFLSPPQPEDLFTVLQTAMEMRRELREIASQQDVNRVEKRLNADLVKPQINLLAGYRSTGLAGTAAGRNIFGDAGTALYERINRLSVQSGFPALQPPDLGSLPNVLAGGYGASLSNMFAGRNHTFQIAVVVDWATSNTEARAELAKSAIAERQLKLKRALVEQAIEAEVRDALQALQTARQRIAASEASVNAAKEKLASEDRLFQSGESTNFLVLTRQNEYQDSCHRLLVARLDLRKSSALLRKAMGTTAQDHGIVFK